MIALASVITLVLMGVSGVPYWVRWTTNWHRGEIDPPIEIQNPLGLVDVLLSAIAWMIPPSLAVSAWFHTWGVSGMEQLNPDQMNWIQCSVASSQLLGCIALLAYFQVRYGEIDLYLGVPASTGRGYWALAGQTFLMFIPGLLVLQFLLTMFIPYEHQTLNHLAKNFSLFSLATSWFAAVIAAPICEEIFFRGVLQGWLQRVFSKRRTTTSIAELSGGWDDDRWGSVAGPRKDALDTNGDSESVFRPLTSSKNEWDHVLRKWFGLVKFWLPIILSSAAFSAAHLGQGPAPVTLFILGLILGFLFRYTGSIVPCIGVHFLLNAYTMTWVTLDLGIS